MNKIQRNWNKTTGYKTKTGAVLYLMFKLFTSLFPSILDESGKEVIQYTIDLIILTGGADWAWRNRKKILQWIINIFKTKPKKK